MGVMMLAAGLGSEVEIETDGADEQAAMDALRGLIEDKFGEGAVAPSPSAGADDAVAALRYSGRMSIQVFGMPVSRGVAIGRAVLVASSRVDVAHYFIGADRVEPEIDRLREARDAVAAELGALQARPAGRGARRAVGAARRAPDAAARRDR